MLEKKLVTLACVAGILACGSCFLPPPAQHPPPPPPVRAGLDGVHDIRVEATNVSESHHLDPSVLARQVAILIGTQGRNSSVTGHAAKDAEDGDAVLRIVITSENATPRAARGDTKLWEFQIGATATLTRADGKVIWTETNGGFSFFRSFPHQSPGELWSDPVVLDRLQISMGEKLVFPMLYGH